MSTASQGVAADGSSAVAHLIELGYEDPAVAAAARASQAQAREALLANVRASLNTGLSGAMDRAIGDLETLARQDPQWPGPRQLLARIYMRRGDFDSAAAELQWLELHGVEHPELALMRAAIALRRRELDAALDHAEYAKFLHEPLPAAEVIIGEVHFRRAKLQDAEAAYQRALDADPEQAAALSGLAAVHLRLGDYPAAVDYALQALERDMNHANTHYRLGLALLALGRQTEAATALEFVGKLNPRLAGPHRFLARIYEAQNDPRASEHRSEAQQVIARRGRARQRECGRMTITAGFSDSGGTGSST